MTAPESPQPVDAPDDDKSHVPPLTTRVVIAEDEALIRLDLKEMLEEEGYSVVGEAGDGQQAVELAREHRPDLVILDVKMPMLDGISAAEKIAEESIAPVLMLTAFSQRDLVERARDAGAMAYLVKPFSKSDVVPAIEMAVSRFTELKALESEVADLIAAAGDAEAGGPGEERFCRPVRADRAGRVPVDPEDVDGPADVDAAGRRGGHRGRRGEEGGEGLSPAHVRDRTDERPAPRIEYGVRASPCADGRRAQSSPRYALRTDSSCSRSWPVPERTMLADLHDVAVVGERERRLGVLLDEQDRGALGT